MNSRPLTDVILASRSGVTPLTLNHLIRLNSSVASPPIATHNHDNYARERFKLVQYAADQFWNRWVVEYLRTMQTRSEWHLKRRNLKPGDVVLVQEISLPRGKWLLGEITKVFPDKLGYVRSGMLKIINGLIKRPIVKLCLILQAILDGNDFSDFRF